MAMGSYRFHPSREIFSFGTNGCVEKGIGGGWGRDFWVSIGWLEYLLYKEEVYST
jgi:hypothetical protein